MKINLKVYLKIPCECPEDFKTEEYGFLLSFSIGFQRNLLFKDSTVCSCVCVFGQNHINIMKHHRV